MSSPPPNRPRGAETGKRKAIIGPPLPAHLFSDLARSSSLTTTSLATKAANAAYNAHYNSHHDETDGAGPSGTGNEYVLHRLPLSVSGSTSGFTTSTSGTTISPSQTGYHRIAPPTGHRRLPGQHRHKRSAAISASRSAVVAGVGSAAVALAENSDDEEGGTETKTGRKTGSTINLSPLVAELATIRKDGKTDQQVGRARAGPIPLKLSVAVGGRVGSIHHAASVPMLRVGPAFASVVVSDGPTTSSPSTPTTPSRSRSRGRTKPDGSPADKAQYGLFPSQSGYPAPGRPADGMPGVLPTVVIPPIPPIPPVPPIPSNPPVLPAIPTLPPLQPVGNIKPTIVTSPTITIAPARKSSLSPKSALSPRSHQFSPPRAGSSKSSPSSSPLSPGRRRPLAPSPLSSSYSAEQDLEEQQEKERRQEQLIQEHLFAHSTTIPDSILAAARAAAETDIDPADQPPSRWSSDTEDENPVRAGLRVGKRIVSWAKHRIRSGSVEGAGSSSPGSGSGSPTSGKKGSN